MSRVEGPSDRYAIAHKCLALYVADWKTHMHSHPSHPHHKPHAIQMFGHGPNTGRSCHHHH